MRWVLLVVSLGIMAPTAALARPQDGSSARAREAKEAFEAGKAAFARKEYESAARHFEEAHARVPAGEALFNAASAWSAAGNEARAADILVAAIAVPAFSSEGRTRAERRLAELRRNLATVRVDGPADLRVNLHRIEGRSPPFSTHLEPGKYRMGIVAADGSERTQSLEVTAGETVRVELTPSAIPQVGVGPTPPPPPPPPEPSPTAKIIGWTGLGLGVAAGAVAGGLGAMALSARDEFLASDRYDLDARGRAVDLRTATNVAWISGAVLGATGISILIWDATRETAATSITFRLTPTSAGFVGVF